MTRLISPETATENNGKVKVNSAKRKKNFIKTLKKNTKKESQMQELEMDLFFQQGMSTIYCLSQYPIVKNFLRHITTFPASDAGERLFSKGGRVCNDPDFQILISKNNILSIQ